MSTIAADNVQRLNKPFTHTLTITIPDLSGLANSQVWKVDAPFAGTLTAMRYRSGAPTTTASKGATLTAQINGSAVTGGVVAIASNTDTGTTGAAKSASSITAGNTFTAGQTIEFAVSSVTAFVEGSGVVEFDITN